MKFVIGSILMFVFVSCQSAKFSGAEFFFIRSIEDDSNVVDYLIESYVISNPPSNRQELIDIIEAYNRKTISIDDIMKHKCIIRFFHKETRNLTRHYKEGAPYPTWWGNIIYNLDGKGQRYYLHGQLVSAHLDLRNDGSVTYSLTYFPGKGYYNIRKVLSEDDLLEFKKH